MTGDLSFDVCGPLPTGTTVLEASAGTGKTYTIAALAARYLAEGRAELSELMLVTFGREATNELRERVRERLVSAERGLADPAAARSGPDVLLALLAGVDDIEVAARRARLSRAVAQFDAATIATTHQFCQRMLAGLGVAGDADPDAVFTESVDDLLAEVVDDFYVRKYADHGTGSPAFSRAEALTVARRAVYDGQARLEPVDAEPGGPADVRRRFAAAVRAEVGRRKQAHRLYTYDDMLTRLDAALADPARGAAQRLRARYRVVLVDEFQDTDPVQWSILRRAFHGAVTLVLIGDPKQAIYAFRGADVVSYLEATEAAGRHATLARNWRSDPALLRALDTVLGAAALGDPRIAVHPVEAAHRGRRLRGAPVDTPLRLRVVPRGELPRTPRDLTVVGPTRELVAHDLAADVAALLAGPAQLRGRPVRPGDVAVLVRTNEQGVLIRDALAAVPGRPGGVPAVLSGTVSVFSTPVATAWLTLLEACEQPRLARLKAVALTCFVGHSVADLCGPGGTELLDELGGTVREWAAVLAERGVAALLEAVTTGTALPRRLLARTDGERTLTDLRHVAQSLHAAATAGHLGPAALLGWLRHRIADAADDVGLERSRRLESDAAAVQIITIHRSKGLEFPIVYLPFGWDRNVRDPEVPLLHDDRGRRVLDVGGETGEGWKERCARHRAEEAGEDLRLLYVALTRAQCQVVAWWAPATTAATSPLHRLLLGRSPASPRAAVFEPAERYRVPADTAAAVALRAWAGPEIAVELVAPAGPTGPVGMVAAGVDGALRAATFARVLDTRWRRTSYTALTAGAGHHGPEVSSEPEQPGTVDEAEVAPPDPVQGHEPDGTHDHEPDREPSPAAPDLPSPLAEFPLGAGFGTLVHAVFEVADLTAPDLPAELAAHCTEQLRRGPLPAVHPEALAAALLPVARTPLGPLADGLRLADIGPADRLAELDFELPLAGGDRADPDMAGRTMADRTATDQTGRGRPAAPDVTLGDLAPLLRRHLAPIDPLHDYPSALATPGLADQPLRGYLTGSIDAVLRLPGPRFAIVDYKTNWLGPLSAGVREPLTAAHYTPPLLAAAMIAANYPLQALLYGVALHRYLRWRLPGYTAQRHLGGVLYLFVRGMCGPDTPVVEGVPCGVFSWAPPAALTVELSELLDRGGTVTAVLVGEPDPTVDPGDARLARSATGLLAEFNRAAVLDAADVHVATRVGGLAGERSEPALLALALAVRALRLGSVCIDLSAVSRTVLGEADELLDVSALAWPEPAGWLAGCRTGPLVADGADAPGGRPLRLVDGLLYLDRYWREEESVRRSLAERAAAPPPVVDLPRLRAGLEELFGAPEAGQQRLAAAVGVLRRVSVLAGGPGTGKTTTVAGLLALLFDQPGPPPRVALAAPTGKAAARLEEAVAAALPARLRDRVPPASTLHRLLGRRFGAGSNGNGPDGTQRLPFDVVVVDETSMVSLTMMARLLAAVRPQARLILVGDPDQLASVEAGAVLGDLARADGRAEPALDAALAEVGLPGGVRNGVVTLDHVWRFGGTIAELARAVQAGDADTAVGLLTTDHDDLEFTEPGDIDAVRRDVVAAGRALATAAVAGDAAAALAALAEHRVLCAHRQGPFGVARWTADIERWLPAPAAAGEPWYPGRPVLITANDYDTGLFNGDIGVVVSRPEGPRVAFARGGPPTLYPPARLSDVVTVHAMTVHRGQGSQFRRVTVVLPPAESPLLTRELLYTAVTRAREHVRVVGSAAAVRAAVERPVSRASGLRNRLAR